MFRKNETVLTHFGCEGVIENIDKDKNGVLRDRCYVVRVSRHDMVKHNLQSDLFALNPAEVS